MEEIADCRSVREIIKTFAWSVLFIMLLAFFINCAIVADELNMGILQYISISILSFLEEKFCGIKFFSHSLNILGILTFIVALFVN